MNFLDKYAGVLASIAIVLAIVGWFYPAAVENLGASGTRFPNGISADTTSPVAGEVRGTDLTITDDATISGGTINLTTSNTATSTVTVGCVQTYATSTATAVRLGFDLNATTTAKNQYGTTVGGFVSWGFGTCPF